MKKEELKEMLEKQGLEAEKVAEVLAEYEEKQEKERKILENTLSVKEAAQYLDKKLEDKWNEAKVRRFIADDEIKPMVAPGNAKKLGYKIEKEELDRFIKEYSMTKEDWKQYAKQWKQEAERYKKLYEEELKSKMESPEGFNEVSNDSEGLELVQNEEANQEVSEVGEEPETANLEQSDALKVKVTYPKVKRHLNDERFEVQFKKNGVPFTGVLSVFRLDIEKAQLLGVESMQSSEAYDRGNDDGLVMIEAIEKEMFPKIQDKLVKAIDEVKEKEE